MIASRLRRCTFARSVFAYSLSDRPLHELPSYIRLFHIYPLRNILRQIDPNSFYFSIIDMFHVSCSLLDCSCSSYIYSKYSKSFCNCLERQLHTSVWVPASLVSRCSVLTSHTVVLRTYDNKPVSECDLFPAPLYPVLLFFEHSVPSRLFPL